VALNQRFGDDG